MIKTTFRKGNSVLKMVAIDLSSSIHYFQTSGRAHDRIYTKESVQGFSGFSGLLFGMNLDLASSVGKYVTKFHLISLCQVSKGFLFRTNLFIALI